MLVVFSSDTEELPSHGNGAALLTDVVKTMGRIKSAWVVNGGFELTTENGVLVTPLGNEAFGIFNWFVDLDTLDLKPVSKHYNNVIEAAREYLVKSKKPPIQCSRSQYPLTPVSDRLDALVADYNGRHGENPPVINLFLNDFLALGSECQTFYSPFDKDEKVFNTFMGIKLEVHENKDTWLV